LQDTTLQTGTGLVKTNPRCGGIPQGGQRTLMRSSWHQKEPRYLMQTP